MKKIGEILSQIKCQQIRVNLILVVTINQGGETAAKTYQKKKIIRRTFPSVHRPSHWFLNTNELSV